MGLGRKPRAPQGSGGLDRRALPPTSAQNSPTMSWRLSRGFPGGEPPRVCGHAQRGHAKRRFQRDNSLMAITKEAFISALLESIATSQRHEAPYRHWILERCLPDEAVSEILALPFPAPELGGLSGRRELHNATRRYFDVENR